jgi:hypothetical protein
MSYEPNSIIPMEYTETLITYKVSAFISLLSILHFRSKTMLEPYTVPTKTSLFCAPAYNYSFPISQPKLPPPSLSKTLVLLPESTDSIPSGITINLLLEHSSYLTSYLVCHPNSSPDCRRRPETMNSAVTDILLDSHCATHCYAAVSLGQHLLRKLQQRR